MSDGNAFYYPVYRPYSGAPRKRKRVSNAQADALEAVFQRTQHPSALERLQLSNELDMAPRRVQIWFQNRRAKEKKDSTGINHSNASEETINTSPNPINNKIEFSNYQSQFNYTPSGSTRVSNSQPGTLPPSQVANNNNNINNNNNTNNNNNADFHRRGSLPTFSVPVDLIQQMKKKKQKKFIHPVVSEQLNAQMHQRRGSLPSPSIRHDARFQALPGIRELDNPEPAYPDPDDSESSNSDVDDEKAPEFNPGRRFSLPGSTADEYTMQSLNRNIFKRRNSVFGQHQGQDGDRIRLPLPTTAVTLNQPPVTPIFGTSLQNDSERLPSINFIIPNMGVDTHSIAAQRRPSTEHLTYSDRNRVHPYHFARDMSQRGSPKPMSLSAAHSSPQQAPGLTSAGLMPPSNVIPVKFFTSLLLASVEQDNYESVRSMLMDQSKIPKDTEAAFGTAIHTAVRLKNERILRLLLESQRVDINVRDARQSTALHIASYQGNLSMCTLLVLSGARMDITDENGSTALHLACASGNSHVASELLNFGAALEAKDNKGRTPLHAATLSGNDNIVQILINYGSNVNAYDFDYHTALYYAVREGHQKTAFLLTTNGATDSNSLKRS